VENVVYCNAVRIFQNFLDDIDEDDFKNSMGISIGGKVSSKKAQWFLHEVAN